MTHLSLKLFGTFEAQVRGQSIKDFYSDKVRALLAYLCVEADQPHNRAVLAGLLWPDQVESKAKQNLRLALFHLRKTIVDTKANPPLLLVTRTTVQLNQESDIQVDVALFDQLISENTLFDQDSEVIDFHVLQALSDAVALYRDDFLAQLFIDDSNLFEEWATLKREFFRQKALLALRLLVTQHSRRGEHQQAVQFGQRWLEIEPWQEEAHRQLMRLYFALGDQNAALAQYESCRQMVRDELGIEPTEETVTLYKDIRLAKPSRALLPMQVTPFIGRNMEMSTIHQRLTIPTCRVLTLVGSGGVGKTRLAIESANQIRTFLHGVYFVSLTEVESADRLALVIGEALGLTFFGRTPPKEQVLNYLHEKEILLVLDNFENLLNEQTRTESQGFVMELLNQTSKVTLLITSRTRLRLHAEWVLDVEGLRYPVTTPGDDALSRYEAVQLFVSDAQRVQARFALSSENRTAVYQICRLLEGLPLAIELTTAWLPDLDCAEIVTEIEKGLDLLTTTMPDVSERHRSIRVVIAHSWATLSAVQQRVLCHLSIFRGGFDLDAATKITDATPPLLTGLVDKSLLRVTQDGRYQLHELVRKFLAEKLDESADSVRENHSDYYLNMIAQEKGATYIHIPRKLTPKIQAEMDNIDQAWLWALNEGKLSTLGASFDGLTQYFNNLGLNETALDFYDRLLALLPAVTVNKQEKISVLNPEGSSKIDSSTIALLIDTFLAKGHILKVIGQLAAAEKPLTCAIQLAEQYQYPNRLARGQLSASRVMQDLGSVEEALQVARQALAFFESVEEKEGQVYAMNTLTKIFSYMGDHDRTLQQSQKILKIAQAGGFKFYEAQALNHIGIGYSQRGDHIRAESHFRQAMEANQALDNKFDLAASLNNLMICYLHQGRYDQSLAVGQQTLEINAEIGYKQGRGRILGNIALTYQTKGDLDQALIYGQKASQIFLETGNDLLVAYHFTNLGHIYRFKKEYDEAFACYEKSINYLQDLEKSDYFLCEPLVFKAQLLFLRGDYAAAQLINDEGIQLATAAKQPSALFEGKILAAKLIDAQGDNRHAQDQLELLFTEADDSEEEARVHFELWQLGAGEKHQQAAFKIYQQLDDAGELEFRNKEYLVKLETAVANETRFAG